MSQSTGSSVSGLQQLQHVSSVAAFLSLERGINSCGARAQSLHSMRDLPGSGVEPMSPALAGRFSTTEPPRKPNDGDLMTLLRRHCTQHLRHCLL